jgi:predicted RNA-binding Zn-ribbon protein involved in translation (DUF1610 family)
MKYVVPCLSCGALIELEPAQHVIRFTSPCCGVELVFDQLHKRYMTAKDFSKRWCIHGGIIYGREMCN